MIMASKGFVMVVDDDDVTNFLTRKLWQKDHPDSDVKTFTRPTEALEELRRRRASAEEMPEMIFLDINMPEMTGFEFLDEMMASDLGHLPVTMHTSSGWEKDRRKSLEYANVKGYLEKPFSMQAYGRLMDNSWV
jgi:CheY-like chemotaxis protein